MAYMNYAPLPQDLARLNADQLRALLLNQAKANSALQAINTDLQSVNTDLQAVVKYKDAVISKVTLELALLRRFRFSKSAETLTIEQRHLFDETLDGDLAQIETEQFLPLPQADQQAIARTQPKRQPLPPELPRVDIGHEPDSLTCKCGCQLKRIGQDVSEKLDYQPGTFRVERHIRGKWVCQDCETLIQSPVPAHVINKGMATTNLLNADNKRKNAKDKDSSTKKAYLWAYASTQHSQIKAVVFDFTPGRSGQHARLFLKDWSGTLVCDDYQGYKALIKDNKITEAGCLAHARRKFFDLFAANKSHIAHEALTQFSAIYGIEAKLQDIPADERRQRRQMDIKPLMDKLRQWLLDHKIKVPDGAGTMKAIDYSLKRWDALTTFLDDPHTPIDNNWVENQIRPIAVGRKNWLFVGSVRAGQRNAAIMSLVHSARLNGLNPLEYLRDVLDRLPTQINSRIHELLPHNWKPVN